MNPGAQHLYPIRAAGEMADRVRAFDWATTALGPLAGWPERLTVAVELMLASPQLATLAVGPERVFLYNDAAAPIYGRRHPDVLGQPLAQAFAHEFAEVAPFYDRVFAGESLHVAAQPLDPAQRGSADVFDAYLMPVRDAEGVVLAAWMTGTAVDERERAASAEAKLGATEQRYRTLFDLIDQAFCVVEMVFDAEDRPVDYIFREANSAFCAQTGLSDVIGRSALDLVPELEPYWFEIYGRVVRSGEPARFEERTDAMGRWYDVYAFATGNAGGNQLGILFSDISARKLQEERQSLLLTLRAQQAFLLRLADALRPLADPVAAQDVAARMLGTELQVDRCYYAEFDWPRDVLHIRREYVGAASFSVIGSHPISAFQDMLQYSHRGEPLVCDNIATHPEFHREVAAYRERGTDGFILVPLVKEGIMVACMCVTMATPRAWSAADVDLVREVAERTWGAVERARAEAATRESEARSRLLIGTVAQAVWETDAAGVVVADSPSWRTYTGQALEEWLGYGWLNAVHPDDRAYAGRQWREAVSARDIVDAEFRLRTRDGGWRWTNVRAAPVIDTEGRIEKWAGMNIDIDARRRNETALRESEERLRQFGEASQDILWIRDAETLQWIYLTPAFETIYGLSRDAALAGDNYRNWQDLIVPEDRNHALDSIARVRAGEHVTFEFRIRRPSDGAVRWLRNTDFPITDDTGAVTLIGGIGHDFTVERETELRFQSLVEGIPQLVWRAIDGGEWTWASPQWTACTGQAAAAYNGWGWLAALHPDDRAAACAAWAQTPAQEGFEVDYRVLRRSDGAYRWFQTRATPVRDRAGRIVEWLGTSTDIHEQRRMQELQATLLAELQHRVRNILAVTRAIVRRTDDGERSTEEYVQHLEGRIAALSRTQVMLTRAAGAGVFLEDLIRDELLAQVAADDQFTLDGPEVELSPKAAEVLTLAIHELATNATKYGVFSRDGGRLAIRWDTERRDDATWLMLDWAESGVPIVDAAPRRHGFGAELVSRRIPYELKGHGRFDLRPGGLHSRIEFPLGAGDSILQTDGVLQ